MPVDKSPIDRAIYRWSLWIIGIGLTAIVLIWFGRNAGESAAEKDKERLQLLWPDIMAMPADDRSRIVRAAMECKLFTQPVQADAVAQCLYVGAEGIREKDVLAAERIHQLVRDAGH